MSTLSEHLYFSVFLEILSLHILWIFSDFLYPLGFFEILNLRYLEGF